jgi:7-keto-8-aminopelargonate synthetase-like enzyme
MLGSEIEFTNRDYIQYKGENYLYLAGIDYHRMTKNPLIIQSMCESAQELGINPTGSRSTTGNHSIYLKLEKKVAEFFGTESSVILPSGYLANTVLLQAIADDFDYFFVDEKAHSSLIDAVALSGVEPIVFNHLDDKDLESKIVHYLSADEKPLVLTDGVYPANGEIPPLDRYGEIIKKYNGKILIDDAHAMAVIGDTGKGSWECRGVDRDLIYQTGTLSKGFGVFGGVIVGSEELINSIHNKSRAFVGSTDLALPLAAAAITSITNLIENRDIITNLQKKALMMKEKFRELGFNMPNNYTPIFSITYHDEAKNKRLYNLLLQNKIFPPFINYPGAPAGGHFRFIITSETTDEQMELLYKTIESSL